jgi:hypothetical protein
MSLAGTPSIPTYLHMHICSYRVVYTHTLKILLSFLKYVPSVTSHNGNEYHFLTTARQ